MGDAAIVKWVVVTGTNMNSHGSSRNLSLSSSWIHLEREEADPSSALLIPSLLPLFFLNRPIAHPPRWNICFLLLFSPLGFVSRNFLQTVNLLINISIFQLCPTSVSHPGLSLLLQSESREGWNRRHHLRLEASPAKGAGKWDLTVSLAGLCSRTPHPSSCFALLSLPLCFFSISIRSPHRGSELLLHQRFSVFSWAAAYVVTRSSVAVGLWNRL